MKAISIGKTFDGLAIPAFQWGQGQPHALLIGGVHGDEPEGINACFGLFQAFEESFEFDLRVTMIPMLNLDGAIAKTRKNANEVDLNRNMPTSDWTSEVSQEKYAPGEEANSEPESQALVRFLEKERPSIILSFHSWTPLLNVNGDCNPEAEILANKTGYEIKESIGYPTPGCLGTYAGLERDIPTITYEIERGLKAKNVLAIHVPAVLEALKTTQEVRK